MPFLSILHIFSLAFIPLPMLFCLPKLSFKLLLGLQVQHFHLSRCSKAQRQSGVGTRATRGTPCSPLWPPACLGLVMPNAVAPKPPEHLSFARPHLWSLIFLFNRCFIANNADGRCQAYCYHVCMSTSAQQRGRVNAGGKCTEECAVAIRNHWKGRSVDTGPWRHGSQVYASREHV